MIGKVLQVCESGSVALLVVEVGDGIVEVPMERRYLWEFAEGIGLEATGDLEGRMVEVSGDLSAIDVAPEVAPSEN